MRTKSISWSAVEQGNTCLPTMVCAQHTHVQLGTWTRATAENSNRWKHTSVGVQVDSDDQRKQATTSCSLLCVRSDTTHPVSNKTGRPRVQHTTQWDTDSHTHTQRDSTQRLFNVMDSTSWQWSLSKFQSTCSWKYIKRTKAQQQRSHQSPGRQQVWSSWGTEMTSGHSTAKDIWSDCTEHNAKHSSCQTNGAQFQQQSWKTTEEQL